MTCSLKKITQSQGFTLIEVMIALVIISLLISIAVPSYREHIAKSHRTEAQINLLQAVSFMERFYTENNRYDQNTTGAAVALPAGIVSTMYNFAVTGLTQTSFTLTATPTGAQATDACGTYSIRENSVRAATGEVFVGGRPTLLCWPN